MAHSHVLHFGEISWDQLWVVNNLPEGEGQSHLLKEADNPGGCALNSAVNLSLLATQLPKGSPLQITLAGNAIGEDPRGAKVLSYLKEKGVLCQIKQKKQTPTPFCQVLVEENTGRRSFILSHESIQMDYTPLAPLIQETLQGKYSHIFVQPYIERGSHEFLKAVQKTQAWILAQDLTTDAPCLPLVDALQLSMTDLENPPQWTETALTQFAKEFYMGRCETLIITAGAQGVALCEKNRGIHFFQTTPLTQIVDTTGCGDAFRSGLMFQLTQNKSLEEAIQFGQKVATCKAQELGSHLSTWPMEDSTLSI